MQALHAYGLPLALLLTDRLIAAPRARTAIALGACMAMMAYTSGYIALFGVLMMAVAMVVTVRDRRMTPHACVPMFALPAVTAAALTVPVLIPYRRVAADQHMVRSLEEIAQLFRELRRLPRRAGPHSLLDLERRHLQPSGRSALPGLRGHDSGPDRAVLRHPRPRTRPRSRCSWQSASAGLVLSFGTATPVYGWLFNVLPPMQTIRAASRFGTLFLLAIALLAGFGIADLRRAAATAARSRRWRSPRSFSSTSKRCARRSSIGAGPAFPTIYKALAQQPDAVLAEMPFYPGAAGFQNAEYVLNSTAHWRPLLNGYSSYAPAGYAERAAADWHGFRETRRSRR